MSEAVTERRPILNSLTGIRFLAAIVVLLFHYGAGFAQRSSMPMPIVNLLKNGYLGVSLFFMLSGFIITYTYDRRINSSADVVKYGIARFARIYPVYLFALLFALPFAWSTLSAFQASMVLVMLQSWTLPASTFGYSWLMQAWTLSVELFFYIMAPVLLLILRDTGTRRLAILAVALAVMMVLFNVPTTPPGATPPMRWLAFVPLPLLRLIEFMFGMVLCKLATRHDVHFARIATNPLTTLNVVLIVGIIMATRDRTSVSIAMVLTGVLLIQLACGTTYVSRMLGTGPMILLGSASYALYLLQWPVRELLRALPLGGADEFLNPFVAVGLSIAVYLWWEEPARRWIRRRADGFSLQVSMVRARAASRATLDG